MDQVGDKPEEVRKHLEREQAETGTKQPSKEARRESEDSDGSAEQSGQ
ncbi:hypothetical protein AB0E88_05270 [Streptomyces sp. NPDC028635]